MSEAAAVSSPLRQSTRRVTDEGRIEVFCNAVAGSALVPPIEESLYVRYRTDSGRLVALQYEIERIPEAKRSRAWSPLARSKGNESMSQKIETPCRPRNKRPTR